MKSTIDPRQLLQDAPMSRAQVAGVALTSALSALDGYDVLSVTFAAPGISADWGLGKAALGVVLSSGLAGMALGSLFLAPFADIWGRRAIAIVSLVLMGSGMLASAFAPDITTLAFLRVITGLGIGAMVPIITPLAVEYANARRRGVAMAFMSIGYPLGGMIGGFIAAALLHRFPWPAVFLFGAGLAAVLLPMVLLWLPEPLAFPMARRNARSLDRVNLFLARCGHAPVAELPPAEPPAPAPYRAIFGRGQAAATLRITAVNLLFIISVYYFLSWLPQLVADAGFSAATATSLSATSSLVGVAACLGFGVLAGWLKLRPLVATTMIAMGLSLAVFGFTPASLVLLTCSAALVGVFLFSGIVGLYSTIADTFAPQMRTTGTGFVMGVGRAGGALAPLIAGSLFAWGLGRGEVSLAMGVGAVLAGLLVLLPVRKLS
jgi:AAHS family 4-hydroxybenzoate transporter-like MFS transporter